MFVNHSPVLLSVISQDDCHLVQLFPVMWLLDGGFLAESE